MSVFSFYILFTKLMQQQKIINQGRKVRASFWNSPNLREAATKLETKSAYRAIVDDALVAQDQHGKLTDPIDQHDWMANSLARSQGAIGARLGEGLAFLATVGSTAPFIGLFGTVVGIYRALIKIGACRPGVDRRRRRPGRRSADHDRARPGRRGSRGARLQLADPPQQVDHGGPRGLHQRPSRLSDVERRGEAAHGRRGRQGAARQTKSSAAPTQPGSEPLRTGQTPTGAQATPTTAELISSRAGRAGRPARDDRSDKKENRANGNERRPRKTATKKPPCPTSTSFRWPT